MCARVVSAPTTLEDEHAIHEALRPFLAHGREFYKPTRSVLAVVNRMREASGMQPLRG